MISRWKKCANFNIKIAISAFKQEKQIVREFEQLRQQVHAEGLMLPQPAFYVRKVGEVFGLLGLAFWLQYCTHYVLSAMVLALTWQQMGWQVVWTGKSIC